jgi:8-oxo-dGTP diphosphatase
VTPTIKVVAALMVRDGKLLICQRTRYQTMPLKWEFPGGKIEDGETAKHALVRELDEELGIQPDVGPEVARLRHRYPRGKRTVELRFFLVKEWEGEVDNRIFRDVRWVSRRELPSYDFLEADVKLVREIAAGKVV